jgi:hypothetical protein
MIRKPPNIDESEFPLSLQRKLFKDHIIVGKHKRLVDQEKAVNSCLVDYGVGR